jgi:hypothetical protein
MLLYLQLQRQLQIAMGNGSPERTLVGPKLQFLATYLHPTKDILGVPKLRPFVRRAFKHHT